MKRYLPLFGFIFISHLAVAASFDCNSATTRLEKMICSNPELSAMDEKLVGIYKMALEHAPDQKVLREEQRQWLKLRDNCSDTACVEKAYQARIASLENRASSSKGNAKPFLTIPAHAKNTPNPNVIKKETVEMTGNIEFGHNEAGGYYWLNDGKEGKKPTLFYVWEIDEKTASKIEELESAGTKITVKGTLLRWKGIPAEFTFDTSEVISIYK